METSQNGPLDQLEPAAACLPKVALITGISGQDGSYLYELLSRKGYVVHGVTRSGGPLKWSPAGIPPNLRMHRIPQDANAQSGGFWESLLERVQPDELYHLAADSFIPSGWENPLDNLDANAGLTIQILEAIRRTSPQTRLLNACSREIFGRTTARVVDEETVLCPMSPYGINKAASRWMLHAYQDKYGIFATNAILFNHESPRREERFVTRKISKRAAEISVGLAQRLELGNLTAARDWGFAGDYVDAMWRMLQIDTPEDFVIGTGRIHTIGQFVSQAFASVGLKCDGYIRCDASLVRANDPSGIAADISKAERLLGWTPQVSFDQLVEMMVAHDLHSAQIRARSTRRAA
jgi:GDPmannose 4,6-dehydratase